MKKLLTMILATAVLVAFSGSSISVANPIKGSKSNSSDRVEQS